MKNTFDLSSESAEQSSFWSALFSGSSGNVIVHSETPSIMIAGVLQTAIGKGKWVEYEKSVSAGRMKFECFLDLESAISWMTDILDQEATDAWPNPDNPARPFFRLVFAFVISVGILFTEIAALRAYLSRR